MMALGFAFNNRAVPTVIPVSGFNAVEDAVALRQAMKGFGTDEQAIIDILTKRSYNQRQEISKTYATEIERDLIRDLKSELSGNFKKVIIGLMTHPVEYLCEQLHNALTGILRCNKMALVEILCTRDYKEIKQINDTYEILYKRPLIEHVCSVTSGDFRRFMTLIATAVRNQPMQVCPERAREQAEALYAAGEAKWGTDEAVFNKILAHESYGQLKLVFEEYKKISGRTIKQALQSELSGSLLDAMLAVVQNIENPKTFYANQLYKAIDGLGTDDATLIRIIVSRCEIDLGNIKQEYERLYGKTLESDVKGDTSGDYMKTLVALIGGP
ncbi:annexin B10-like isoform X1 [Macrosteles quadrilineatus]|uniref:annexin B10-like isoform X1 n=2 Tax=Macrosteles quadrilineatus TaxID=74068 RepID=UPI0023E1C8DE|nr:annexin B10-like isoform X1 [Macrosteles quadrilineatus]